jgi:hypothetical protein
LLGPQLLLLATPGLVLGDDLVDLIHDELERIAVDFCDFFDGGPIEDDPIAFNSPDTGAMTQAPARGTVPRPSEEFGPFRGRPAREPERHLVQGTTPRAVISGRTDLVGDEADNPDRFKGGRSGV